MLLFEGNFGAQQHTLEFVVTILYQVTEVRSTKELLRTLTDAK